jgi:uncharacterized repeat protein (TIGR04076 family)
MSKVKITVLKKIDPKVIYQSVPVNYKTGKKFGVCSFFKEGEQFIVDESGDMPKGFCSWAWRDIFKDLSVLGYGKFSLV